MIIKTYILFLIFIVNPCAPAIISTTTVEPFSNSTFYTQSQCGTWNINIDTNTKTAYQVDAGSSDCNTAWWLPPISGFDGEEFNRLEVAWEQKNNFQGGTTDPMGIIWIYFTDLTNLGNGISDSSDVFSVGRTMNRVTIHSEENDYSTGGDGFKVSNFNSTFHNNLGCFDDAYPGEWIRHLVTFDKPSCIVTYNNTRLVTNTGFNLQWQVPN